MIDNDNVIPLNASAAAQRRASVNAERQARDEALLERIEILRMTKHFPSARDRELVAENLDRLLTQAERQGIKRRDVVKRWRPTHKDEDSTKVLYRFALDPAKEGSKRERQSAELAKKPREYVRIAEAAAQVMGADQDAVLIELVQGTSLASAAPITPPDPLEDDLRAPVIRHLERLADRIAQRTKLHDTFRLIARYPRRDHPQEEAWTWENLAWQRGEERTGLLRFLLPRIAGPARDPREWPTISSGEIVELDTLNLDPRRLLLAASPNVLLGEVFLEQVVFPLEPQGSPRRPAPVFLPGEAWEATITTMAELRLGIYPVGASLTPRLAVTICLVRTLDGHYFHPWLTEPEPREKEKGHFDLFLRGDFEQQQRLRQTDPDQEKQRRRSIRWSHRIAGRRGKVVDTFVTNGWWRSSVDVPLTEGAGWEVPLFGRPLTAKDWCPVRCLLLTDDASQRYLDLPDNGRLSDWVGPEWNDARLGAEPSFDGVDEEEKSYRLDQWMEWRREQIHAYRYRFEREHEGAIPEAYVHAWPEGTVGYKLERTLMEVEGADSIGTDLLCKAEVLSEIVHADARAALDTRAARLARIKLPDEPS